MEKDSADNQFTKLLLNSESTLLLDNNSSLLNSYINAATSDNTRRAYQ